MTEAVQAVRESSRGGVVLGLATVILGVLAMAAPLASGITVTAVVGILLIAGGIARTVFAFKADSFGQGALTFLFGGLGIVCGAVMLAKPLLGLTSLTMVLIAYFLVDGLTAMIAAFQLRPVKGWGWMLFGGLLSVVLAVLMWRQWPITGAWAVGVLVGANMVFAGWSMVGLGSVGEGVADEMATQQP